MDKEKFRAYMIEALKGFIFALSLGVATGFMILLLFGSASQPLPTTSQAMFHSSAAYLRSIIAPLVHYFEY